MNPLDSLADRINGLIARPDLDVRTKLVGITLIVLEHRFPGRYYACRELAAISKLDPLEVYDAVDRLERAGLVAFGPNTSYEPDDDDLVYRWVGSRLKAEGGVR